MAATFQNSAAVLSYMQGKFGSANFSQWQIRRRIMFSRVTYTEAGATEYSFFADALGSNSTTIEDTNMPKANSFGQVHFLLKSIRTRIFIKTWDLLAFSGLDASTLVSDLFMGFVQAGVLELSINGRPYLQIPKPFMFAPPGDGRPQVYSAGIQTMVLTEASPNTLYTLVGQIPFATQTSKRNGLYLVDPNILIEAEQNFSCKILFPSGVVAVIGTTVTDDTSNPLKIGVEFDGIEFRPVQ